MAADPAPVPLRPPPPLNQLPWDIAQSEFGAQGADFLGVMGELLLRSKQFQLDSYRIDSTADRATLPHLAAQSQIKSGAELSCRGNACDAPGIPPT